MRKTGLLLITVFLMIGLTACGGGTPAATSAPANTPVPDEPATPTLPALSQSVTSETGVTVNYPDGWLDPIATIGVFLYNNADGQATMSFLRARPGGLAFQINTQPGASGQTEEELFDFTFSPLAAGMGITLGEKEKVTLGDVVAIKATGANTDAASQIAIYTALKPVSEGYVTFVVYLHPDEIEAQTPLIEAILATVSYTRP